MWVYELVPRTMRYVRVFRARIGRCHCVLFVHPEVGGWDPKMLELEVLDYPLQHTNLQTVQPMMSIASSLNHPIFPKPFELGVM